jgi:hypothetical protein
MGEKPPIPPAEAFGISQDDLEEETADIPQSEVDLSHELGQAAARQASAPESHQRFVRSLESENEARRLKNRLEAIAQEEAALAAEKTKALQRIKEIQRNLEQEDTTPFYGEDDMDQAA